MPTNPKHTFRYPPDKWEKVKGMCERADVDASAIVQSYLDACLLAGGIIDAAPNAVELHVKKELLTNIDNLQTRIEELAGELAICKNEKIK